MISRIRSERCGKFQNQNTDKHLVVRYEEGRHWILVARKEGIARVDYGGAD